MFRILAAVFVFFAVAAASVAQPQYGTAEEAKAMLERAVAAVKENKAKALDMFNNGEGGFKDRDLYVWCANASDGIITATPYWNRGRPKLDELVPSPYALRVGEIDVLVVSDGLRSR